MNKSSIFKKVFNILLLINQFAETKQPNYICSIITKYSFDMTQNEIVLKILNLGKGGYKDDAEGFEKLNKANKLIEEHITEQLHLYGVSGSLPSDPMVLAKYLHDNYEKIAKITKWQTQKNCKVEFDELPVENRNTMIILASKMILDFIDNKI